MKTVLSFPSTRLIDYHSDYMPPLHSKFDSNQASFTRNGSTAGCGKGCVDEHGLIADQTRTSLSSLTLSSLTGK